jgi:hypothetical protein
MPCRVHVSEWDVVKCTRADAEWKKCFELIPACHHQNNILPSDRLRVWPTIAPKRTGHYAPLLFFKDFILMLYQHVYQLRGRKYYSYYYRWFPTIRFFSQSSTAIDCCSVWSKIHRFDTKELSSTTYDLCFIHDVGMSKTEPSSAEHLA